MDNLPVNARIKEGGIPAQCRVLTEMEPDRPPGSSEIVQSAEKNNKIEVFLSIYLIGQVAFFLLHAPSIQINRMQVNKQALNHGQYVIECGEKRKESKAALLPRGRRTGSKSGCEALFHTSGVRVMQTKDKKLTEEKSTSQRRTRTLRRQAGEQKGRTKDVTILKGEFGSKSKQRRGVGLKPWQAQEVHRTQRSTRLLCFRGHDHHFSGGIII